MISPNLNSEMSLVRTWFEGREFHSKVYWLLPGPAQELGELARDYPERFPNLWHSLKKIQVLEPGDENGLGRQVHTQVRGFLPYTLRLWFLVTHVDFPHTFRVTLTGDLEGAGGGTLSDCEGGVKVHLEMRVKVNGFLPYWFSRASHFLIHWQHQSVLRDLERGLRDYLRNQQRARQ